MQSLGPQVDLHPIANQNVLLITIDTLRADALAAAIDAWTRAVQLDPANFDALYNAGTTLARDGQRDAARPYLEQFLETAPPAFYAKDLKEVEALLRR